jgi:hypothetical protein
MIKIQEPVKRISRLFLVSILALSLLVSQMFLFSGAALADVSTSVTVGSGHPSAPAVDVTPDNPQPGDDLTCTIMIQSTDDDEASIRYTYKWYKYNVVQPDLTVENTVSLTNTIDGSSTSAGETWKCVVTPNDGASEGPSDEDEVTVAPTSGGGITGSGGGGGVGGGGGGGSSFTRLNDYLSGDGLYIITGTTIQSADGRVKIYIPEGTSCQTKNGDPLYIIFIKPVTTPSDPPEDHTYLCLNYDIGPGGSTFEPGVILTFHYDDSEVPEGVAEENLVLVTWHDGQLVQFETCSVDPVNNMITVWITQFSIFTVMANTSPASLEVTGMTVTPNEVYPNEIVIVSVTVTNTGGLTGSKDVILKLNGRELYTTKVTLDGGGRQIMSFAMTSTSAGEQTVDVNGLSGLFNVTERVPVTPAGFNISSLSITPGEVNPSEEVRVSVVVTNIGGSEGRCNVVLKINGQEEASQEITLGAGQNETVTFITSKDMAGLYTVDVAGNAGQFTVVLPPVATSLAEGTTPAPSSTNWWIIVGTIAGTLIAIRIAIFSNKRRPPNLT